MRSPDPVRLLVLGWFLLGCGATLSGQEPSPDAQLSALHAQYTKMALEFHVQQADLKVKQLEARLLESVSEGDVSEATASEIADRHLTALAPEIRSLLLAAADDRSRALKRLDERWRATGVEAVERWKADVATAQNFPEQQREVEVRLGVPFGVEQNRTLWSEYLPIIGPCFFVLMVAGALAYAHELRKEIRQKVRVSVYCRMLVRTVAYALPALLLVVIVGSLLGSRSRTAAALPSEAAWREQNRDRVSAAIAEVQQQITSVENQQKQLAQKLAASRRGVHERWQELLGAARADAMKTAASDFLKAQDETAEMLHVILYHKHLTDDLAADRAARASALGEQAEELNSFIGRHQDLTVKLARNSVMAIVGCLAVGFVPFLGAVYLTRRRRNRESHRCPCCLAKGKLETKEAATLDGISGSVSSIVCNNCRFEFQSSLRDFKRESFPTVGIRSSGKTHWLVIAYDILQREYNRIDPAKVEWIKSKQSDREFQGLLRLYKTRGSNKATSAEKLHFPLMFRLSDKDWVWPQNESIMMLFDFSGETVQMDVSNELKQHALRMDGFLYFLDPTQVRDTEADDPEGKPSGTAEAGAKESERETKGERLTWRHQLNALNDYAANVKQIRGLPPKATVEMPIAVCIPKLDLIEKYNPLGPRARTLLDELRSTDTDGVITLETIEKRSKICEKYLKTMFQGWDVKEGLNSRFGERYMFFPLTPVNINKNEVGIEDSKRSFNPFGIMEPVLWLLHMRGYSVLS